MMIKGALRPGFAIGVISGAVCRVFSTATKTSFGSYDDSLDAFGVHGVVPAGSSAPSRPGQAPSVWGTPRA